MTRPPHDPHPRALAALRGAWRRWALWGALVLVVAGLLATLVWLARGYEIEQVQRDLERDSADAAQALRQRLARNLQDLHSLATTPADPVGWWSAAPCPASGCSVWPRWTPRIAPISQSSWCMAMAAARWRRARNERLDCSCGPWPRV